MMKWKQPLGEIRVIEGPIRAHFEHYRPKPVPLVCKGSFKVCSACWFHVMVFRKRAAAWFRRKR